MFELAKDQTSINERMILKKLRVWIIALATACLLAGIGVADAGQEYTHKRFLFRRRFFNLTDHRFPSLDL